MKTHYYINIWDKYKGHNIKIVCGAKPVKYSVTNADVWVTCARCRKTKQFKSDT